MVHNIIMGHHLGIMYSLANVKLTMDNIKVGGQVWAIGIKGLQIVASIALRVALGVVTIKPAKKHIERLSKLNKNYINVKYIFVVPL
jgi:hypothetical protein